MSAEESRPGAPARGRPLSDLVLIAATEAGYWNLVRLVSDSYMQSAGRRPAPHVGFDALAEHGDGLIALTGGPGGPVNRALVDGQAELAAARLDRLAAIFGDRLYVELQRHGTQAEQAAEPALIDLAYARGLALVATNEAFFPTRDDYEAHDALIAIAEGAVIAEGDRRRLTPEHYFKTRAEMVALFADLPEAIENTVEIALPLQRGGRRRAKPILPRFAGAGADPEEADRRRGAGAARGGRGGAGQAAGGARPGAGLHRGGLPQAARLRARRHREDEVSGLLPDRRRLHPVGEGAGHPGRARAAARAPARWSPGR